MNESIQQRCRRICNGESEPSSQCFINNKRQLTCLSDMLINNVYSISSMLEFALEEEQPQEMRENISEALTISRNLIDWVKYLQITHDIKHLSPIIEKTSHPNYSRSEQRYPFPEHYEHYIELTLEGRDEDVKAKLVNFSRSGLQFKAPVGFEFKELVQGTLSTRHVIGKAVHFKARGCYVLVSGENYITGAQILEVSDSRDFDFFRSIHEFILDFIPTPPELRPLGPEGKY